MTSNDYRTVFTAEDADTINIFYCFDREDRGTSLGGGGGEFRTRSRIPSVVAREKPYASSAVSSSSSQGSPFTSSYTMPGGRRPVQVGVQIRSRRFLTFCRTKYYSFSDDPRKTLLYVILLLLCRRRASFTMFFFFYIGATSAETVVNP